MYGALATALSSDYAVYAIDYPGTGGSDPLPAGTTFEAIAAACIDVLDDLDLQAASVYGLYTGNKIAAAMAAGWPARIKKVVLAGQSHSLVPNNAKRSETVGRSRRTLLNATDDREAALIQWADVFSRVSDVWWAEDMMKHLVDRSARREAIDVAVDAMLSAESMTDLYSANFAYDLQQDLERIIIPTLILEIATPSEDRLIGRQGPLLRSLVRGSNLVTLEEADGHGNTLQHRALEVAAIVRTFLES